MDKSFGEYLKSLRIKRGLTLRAFCEQFGFDPGNYSRLERGLLAPPQSHEKLEEYANALGLKHGGDDWLELFDRAAATRGELPGDLASDEKLIGKLPVLFRTLRGKPVSAEKLEELIKTIRRS